MISIRSGYDLIKIMKGQKYRREAGAAGSIAMVARKLSLSSMTIALPW
jgi:hypothetical protein